MNYTMTMDMPTKASAYVKRRGPRFQSQLRSLVIAFVTTEMQRDSFEWSDDNANETSEENGEDILDMLSGVARGVQIEDDHGILARAEMEKHERISRPKSNSNGKAVFDAIRACPVDVDLGKLISKRTSCGRAHPIDFAAMRKEDA